MALSLNNVNTVTVRSILIAAVNKVSLLCGYANVNKWSRNKPVRGTFPAANDGKYGFDFANNWAYLKPRGAVNSEPFRLGDFRGYEHSKDIACPVIYCLASNAVVPASITPNNTGSGGVGTFTININTSHDNVRITPVDLGVDGYHVGIKVGSFYKTLGVLSNNKIIQFQIALDLSDPDLPTFTDLPYINTGDVTWRLFISSAQQAGWGATQPAGYIELPGAAGETYGSRTIKSNGVFTLTSWIATVETSLGWLYNNGTYTYEQATNVVCSGSSWHVNAIPTGFGIKDSGGATIVAEVGSYLSGDEVHIYALANNPTYTPISGIFIFHDNNHNACEIEVLQTATPPAMSIDITLKTGGNVSNKAYEYSAYIQEYGMNRVDMDIVVDYEDLNDMSQHPLNYTITHNGLPAGSGIIYFNASTSIPTAVYFVMSAGFYGDSGDNIIIELDAVSPI